MAGECLTLHTSHCYACSRVWYEVSIESISDDVIKIYCQKFSYFDNMERSAPENRHLLTILGKYCQKRMKYDDLTTETLP